MQTVVQRYCRKKLNWFFCITCIWKLRGSKLIKNTSLSCFWPFSTVSHNWMKSLGHRNFPSRITFFEWNPWNEIESLFAAICGIVWLRILRINLTNCIFLFNLIKTSMSDTESIVVKTKQKLMKENSCLLRSWWMESAP